eukprot:2194541-Rhodomonas_salina.3
MATTVLRLRCAMSGTDPCYTSAIVLRLRYEMSGADLGYTATVVLLCYAMSGTDLCDRTG